jgi:hypothetical protein
MTPLTKYGHKAYAPRKVSGKPMVVDRAAPASEAMLEEDPQPTAVVSQANALPKLWLLDTGSGHDLVGRDEIPDSVAASPHRCGT